MKKLHVVKESGNRKTGKVAATYRPVGTTCPQDCSLLDNGCYAQRGLSNIHQRNADEYEDDFRKLEGVDLVRHLVTGDAFRGDKLDVQYVKAKLQFHWDHPESQGWSYTHRCADWDDAGLGPEVHPPNLKILASVDSLREARAAQKRGWNTARVTSDPGSKQENEALCPYDFARHHGAKPSVTCRDCAKCWDGSNIVFLKLVR